MGTKSKPTTLRAALEEWVTRDEPWTGPESWTAEDGYNAAIEEVAGILNYHRDEPQEATTETGDDK